MGGRLRRPPAYQLSILDPKKYEKYAKNIQKKKFMHRKFMYFFRSLPGAPWGYPGGPPVAPEPELLRQPTPRRFVH